MNKAQKDYAVSRVEEHAANMIKRLKDECTVGEPLTSQRRAELLRTGKVKMRRTVKEISNYTDVVNAFDFKPFEQKVHPSFARRKARIETTMRRTIDEIMLGDAEQALKLVRSFCGED